MKNKIKKIVLFFNMNRGIKVYEKLKSSYNIKIVIAKKYLDKKILIYLNKNKIPFILIKNLNDKRINFLNDTDLAIACGFPLIFKKSLLNKTKYGFINCHAGKLPEYRGGSPLHWQLINGESHFWISVLRIDVGLDTGNLIEQKKFLIKDNYNITHLQNIADNNFPNLVMKSVKKIEKGQKFKAQNKKKYNLWPQRYPLNSFVDFSAKDNHEVLRLLRACTKPYEAFTFIKGKRLRIIKALLIKKNFPIGVITKVRKKKYIGCREGSILLKKSNFEC